LIALKRKLRGEHRYDQVKSELLRDPHPTDDQLVEIADMLLAARTNTSDTVNDAAALHDDAALTEAV